MALRLPPLQSLLAFEAAARLQSYTRAAEDLNLTHGAISHAIRGLEARLGIQLFQREGRRMVPTPEGQALATKIRYGLRLLESAFILEFPHKEKRHIKVSVLPAFAGRWLVPRLHHFTATHPDIVLDLHPSVELARLDEQDGIDVAIRYGPGGWPHLRQDKLIDEHVFPVCSPAYKAGELPEHPSDLRDCTLLRYLREAWSPWFAAAGLDWPEPKEGPAYRDASLLLDAAVAGQGVALARRALVSEDLRTGRLCRPFALEVPGEYAYWFVSRSKDALDPGIEIFRHWMLTEATLFCEEKNLPLHSRSP
jgi:DNA-binding transcriptional LysR family regulator